MFLPSLSDFIINDLKTGEIWSLKGIIALHLAAIRSAELY